VSISFSESINVKDYFRCSRKLGINLKPQASIQGCYSENFIPATNLLKFEKTSLLANSLCSKLTCNKKLEFQNKPFWEVQYNRGLRHLKKTRGIFT